MSGHQVIRADQGDVEPLAEVIASAFFDLAPSRWLIKSPAGRAVIFPGYFGLLAEQALASGIVHTTAGRDAAALWLPGGPGGPGEAADYDARLAAATGARADRFRAFEAALAARHPADLAHMHLAILAVRPDRQGHGLGTALLGAYHQILDQDRLPAYLEASDLRTRRLYVRYGYSDFGPPLTLPGGPMMHPMVRQPYPGGSLASRPGPPV